MLFGDTVPSGKLTISFPKSTGHLPSYYNHLPTDKGFYHKPGAPGKPGQDYVFSSPDALWPFGHGLGYTTLEYGPLNLSETVLSPDDTVKVNLSINNIGSRDALETVQLYVRDQSSREVTPVKELKAFTKVPVPAGGSSEASLSFPVEEKGKYLIMVGASSADIRQETEITVE